MNIKVCGITSANQFIQLDKLGVDYAGLVFDEQSHQCIIDLIQPEELNQLDLDIKKVGVFSNSTIDEVMRRIEEFELDVVQFTGNETPDFCSVISDQIELIKTFYLNHFNLDTINILLSEFDEVCDYYSFDSLQIKQDSPMSTSFDWKMIGNAIIEKPFFIGGGAVKPSDAPIIHSLKHPDFFGVDINHNFEKEPGLKDIALVLSFIRAVNQIDN